MGTAARRFEEGDPLDRTIFFVLILLAIGILMSRSFNWGNFFARNIALMTLLLFALLSVFWSDFPFVSFKRWFRDLGNYLVILVVLSDPRPLEAVRTLFRRLCFLLIPLSVMLIKYFPGDGQDDTTMWTGVAQYSGATTSKNMLGVACLVSGIFFFWDTVTRWSDRKERRTKRILLVNFAFIGMTLWLLNLVQQRDFPRLSGDRLYGDSGSTQRMVQAPSRFPQGSDSGIFLHLSDSGIWAGHERGNGWRRRPGPNAHRQSRHLEARSQHAHQSARWHWLRELLAGYPAPTSSLEGFGHINEAHNGYLEVYLNLGLVGVFLIAGLLITSYRSICKRLTSMPELASLNIAVWTIMLFYNMTEAAFRDGLMWVIFLLGAIAVSARVGEQSHSMGRVENADVPRFPALRETRVRPASQALASGSRPHS